MHATEPVLPLDLAEATFLVEDFKSGISTEELLVLQAQQIFKHPDNVQRASETLKKARFTSKEQFEKRFHKRLTRAKYEPRDLVLVRNNAIEMSHDRKSKPRYLGPYEVHKETKGGNYKLKELDGTFLRYTYAAFRLLPYITRRHSFMKDHVELEADQSGSESESELELSSQEAD